MPAGWIDINDFNELQRLVKNIQIFGNGYVKYHSGGISIAIGENEGGGGGAAIYWATVTAVVSANSYTCSIYTDDEDVTPIETGKAVYVKSIVDSLSIGDSFPVKATTRTGFDYASIQQLGLL